MVEEKKPHLLVLDEVNIALYCKLLDVKEVLAFLDEVPQKDVRRS
jgi:ATP:corrinoid adenosyltransferase